LARCVASASVALASLVHVQAHAQDVTTLLKDADRFRMSVAGSAQGAKAAVGSDRTEPGGLPGADNLQVDTLVQTFRPDGTPDKERRYTVFAQAGRQSLVLMQSPAEKGQKVLMLGDDFWLLMPGSQRPLRITPMQKLLGDASTGDIATLSWSGDYTATLAGEEPCWPAATATAPGTPEAGADAPARHADDKNNEKSVTISSIHSLVCYRLDLAASRKGVTYQRMTLWLGKQRHEPVRADLYVQSDKLAKQARFVVDKAGAVSEMVLTDQLGNQRQTRVSYLSRQPRTVPPEWLNPMFLARNPSLE
jgi:hypothetical protein